MSFFLEQYNQTEFTKDDSISIQTKNQSAKTLELFDVIGLETGQRLKVFLDICTEKLTVFTQYIKCIWKLFFSQSITNRITQSLNLVHFAVFCCTYTKLSLKDVLHIYYKIDLHSIPSFPTL